MADGRGGEAWPTPGAGALLRRLWRRPLSRVALALLALLYSSAIYAPLLASDLPYWLEAVDRRGYEAARRTLPAVVSALTELSERGSGDDPPAWRASLEGEAEAALRRVDEMRGSLAPGEAELRLQRFAGDIRALVDTALARDEARVAVLAPVLGGAAQRLAAELVPRGSSPQDAGGVELVARTSWPLFASLSGLEVYALLAWTMLLAWPLLAFVGRRRRAAAIVLLPLGVALSWSSLAPSAGARGGASLKQGLSSGEVIVRRALLPPIFFGYAETHTSEGFRPPTWTHAAARDEAGRPPENRARADDPALAGLEPSQSPVEVRYGEPARNAAWRHPLGTDGLGRDLLARLLWGGRVSLSVGLCAAALLSVLGVLLGATAGYFGGWVDFAVSRLIEVVLSIPALFLIVLAAAYVDPQALHPLAAIVAIIALVAWTGVARLTRAEMLKLREAEFVLAARALGFPAWRVILRHALPNALSPLIVAAAFAVGGGILTESVVSYLGFGVRHPFPSWGALVNESRSAEHWWIQVFPGLSIFVTVTCYNLLGEALRDALDPRAEGPRP